jgi:hypothetical protein
VSKYPDDVDVPSFASKIVCAKCGARGRHIDVRPNWKEQVDRPSLTGNSSDDDDFDPIHPRLRSEYDFC